MDNIIKAVNIAKFKEVNIIGSASDMDLKYFSDLDLQEKLNTEDSPQELTKWFQKKIKELELMKNVYFQELKAGIRNGSPLKWDFHEVEQGFQFLDGQKIFLVNVFAQKSVIKIDFIVYQENTFIEVSINYYIHFLKSGNKTFGESSPKEEVANNLLFEYQKLKGEDFYKALKRLYSYYKLVGDTKVLNDMKKVFNSKFGYLNKQLSSLKTIKMLIEQGFNDNETRKRIIKAISSIEYNILKYPKYKTDMIKFTNLPLSVIRDKLDEVIIKLSVQLQEDVQNFITKSKFNYFLK